MYECMNLYRYRILSDDFESDNQYHVKIIHLMHHWNRFWTVSPLGPYISCLLYKYLEYFAKYFFP